MSRDATAVAQQTVTCRRATPQDIPRLVLLRGSVTENRLTDPAGLATADYERFIAAGRIWVAPAKGPAFGFSAADCSNGAIWALFVAPCREGEGLGSALLAAALADLARAGHRTAWLTTERDTRAERFYRAKGWRYAGTTSHGEVRLKYRLA